MNTQIWKVTTPSSEQSITAMYATTTAAGDLLLKRQDGELLWAFAKGAWLSCELVKAMEAWFKSSEHICVDSVQ